jgi:heme-degrading monooxygenase HmoA
MYARITVLEWKPGHRPEGMEEIITLVREKIAPEAKQQKGFKGLLGLLDRRRVRGMVISLWETEADLQASEASGFYRAQLAAVGPLYGVSATLSYEETYEVVVQE